MIARTSGKISSFFAVHGIIPEEDREVYAYSFEVLLSTAISFLFLATGAIISQTVLYTASFLIGFIPLRRIAGGYHAKNHIRCFLILTFTYAVFLTLIFSIPVGYLRLVIILCALLSAFLIFIIAPSEDSNNPLSKEKVIKLKKRCRITVIGFVLLVGLLDIILSLEYVAFSIVFGKFTVGVSLLANLIKRRAFK